MAAGLLQRAIELVADTDPGRGRLRAEWASSLWQAGRLPDAEAACRALLRDSPDPDVERQVRTCLGRTLITQGRMPEALLELDHVRPDSSPPVDRAAARGWASVALGSMGDLDGAADAAEEAGTGAAAASSPTDHTTVSLALNSLAAVAEHRGDPSRGLRVIDDAVLRADRSPERAGHRYPLHVTRGHILMELDRLPDARTTLETGRRISEELGTRWALPSYETFLAVERFLAGAWDDAIAGVETAVEAAAETGERYSLVLGYVVLAVIALHRGDLLQAREMAEAAGREVADGGPRFRGHWLPWVDALLSDADGDTTRAVDLLGEAWDDCARQGLVIEHPVLGPDLVRLALAVGDRNRAEQVTSAMQGPADDGTTPDRYRGAVLRCRGLVDADPSLLLAAVDAYGRCARPLELALAVEDAAVLLTGQGDTDAARTLTERALDAFERLEAARGVARSEARLRGLGVHRGRRGPRGRPRTGWDSLTTTERTVVDLVAEGLSNPQIGERLFLSRRTVQTHVAHIFAKVSVSSRAQLAAAHAARARPSEQS